MAVQTQPTRKCGDCGRLIVGRMIDALTVPTGHASQARVTIFAASRTVFICTVCDEPAVVNRQYPPQWED